MTCFPQDVDQLISLLRDDHEFVIDEIVRVLPFENPADSLPSTLDLFPVHGRLFFLTRCFHSAQTSNSMSDQF